MVAITEVSDEVAATAFGLHTLTHGNVRAQTMRAFTAAEMEKILEHVGYWGPALSRMEPKRSASSVARRSGVGANSRVWQRRTRTQPLTSN